MSELGKIMSLSLLKADKPISVMDDAGVASAWARWQDLNEQLAAVDKEIAAITGELAEARNRRGDDSPTNRAARALFEGKKFEEISTSELKNKYSEAAAKRPVLHRAIEMARKSYNEEHSRASREICESLKARHRDIVNNLAKTLIAVGREMEAERRFRDELEAGQVLYGGYLRVMAVLALGYPRDLHSPIARWLRDAISSELIDQKIVPTDWRFAWSEPEGRS